MMSRWVATVLTGVALLAMPVVLCAQPVPAEPDPAPVTIDQVENEHRSVDGQGRLVTKEQLFTCRVKVRFSRALLFAHFLPFSLLSSSSEPFLTRSL